MNGKFRIPWQLERKDPALRNTLQALPLEAMLVVRNKNPARPNAPQYLNTPGECFENMRFGVTRAGPDRSYLVTPLETPDVKDLRGYSRAWRGGVGRQDLVFEMAKADGMQVRYDDRVFTLYYGTYHSSIR